MHTPVRHNPVAVPCVPSGPDVLAPRPTSVRRVVAVDLPRPRDLSVLTDPRFAAAEAELLGALVR